MDIEKRRVILQTSLDKGKTKESRNVLGQYSTPYRLANDIVCYVRQLVGRSDLSMLEPAIGTGAFYSAFINCFGKDNPAMGYEIDPYYYTPAKKLWAGYGIEFRQGDFLEERHADRKFSLILSNPPYTRHHHIRPDKKKYLQEAVLKETGIKLSGLCGLYCYFILLSSKWLEKDGISCWLVPSEFMDVNYGKAVKEFLLECVDLVSIHRFTPEEVQFDDALVSSSVVVFRNSKPSTDDIRLSTGGSLLDPANVKNVPRSAFRPEEKWTPLFNDNTERSCYDVTIGNFFSVKRGIATGNNSFFIVDMETVDKYEIPSDFLFPVLPAPRNLAVNEVHSRNGMPLLDKQLFLFSCDFDEDTLQTEYPGVWRYIKEGRDRGIHKGANCKRRSPWYSCETRKPAPILITYMGRRLSEGNLFRFILNESRAIATNSYLLLYPKAQYIDKFRNEKLRYLVWNILNNIPKERLCSCGRVYGGGLYKLEPKELMNTPVPEMEEILGREKTLFDYRQ